MKKGAPPDAPNSTSAARNCATFSARHLPAATTWPAMNSEEALGECECLPNCQEVVFKTQVKTATVCPKMSCTQLSVPTGKFAESIHVKGLALILYAVMWVLKIPPQWATASWKQLQPMPTSRLNFYLLYKHLI